MNRLAVLVVVAAMLAACSSGPGVQTNSASSVTANACVTRGGTYLESLTDISGNCGAFPSQVVNVASSGQVEGAAAPSCASSSEDGCTVKQTNCRTTAPNGCVVSLTSSVTFEQDGAHGSGLATFQISCDDGSSCVGTYDIDFARQ